MGFFKTYLIFNGGPAMEAVWLFWWAEPVQLQGEPANMLPQLRQLQFVLCSFNLKAVTKL